MLRRDASRSGWSDIECCDGLTSLATVCQCRWLSHWSMRSWCRNLHLSGTSRASLTNSPTATWTFLCSLQVGCISIINRTEKHARWSATISPKPVTQAAVWHHNVCVSAALFAAFLAPVLDADGLVGLHNICNLHLWVHLGKREILAVFLHT